LDKSTNEATLNIADIAAMNSLKMSLLISWAVVKQKIEAELLKKLLGIFEIYNAICP
jgi:thiamine monophosphate kinase